MNSTFSSCLGISPFIYLLYYIYFCNYNIHFFFFTENTQTYIFFTVNTHTNPISSVFFEAAHDTLLAPTIRHGFDSNTDPHSWGSFGAHSSREIKRTELVQTHSREPFQTQPGTQTLTKGNWDFRGRNPICKFCSYYTPAPMLRGMLGCMQGTFYYKRISHLTGTW